jgi:hypothetical protein
VALAQAVSNPIPAPTDNLEAARAAVVATRLAELMGIFVRPAMSRIDRKMVGQVIEAAADARLAEAVASRRDAANPGDRTIHAFVDALLASPRPAQEINNLVPILGYDTLQRLVGASEVSLRRYASGTRTAPDEVARRIHFVAALVAILRGSFNEFGIRRWFERVHPSLGKAPAAALGRGFEPDDDAAQEVLRTALSLLG